MAHILPYDVPRGFKRAVLGRLGTVLFSHKRAKKSWNSPARLGIFRHWGVSLDVFADQFTGEAVNEICKR